jgi:methylated-DNA-[protein]-cysteine S-methyltransferase
VEYNSKISNICFENKLVDEDIDVVETPIIRECYEQLDQYFKGDRKLFNVPIELSGTDFQKRVYNQLLNIPYGSTASYQEIAIKLDIPKAARAVGGANNKNPIPMIVPCHRVIGKNGSLTGFAGGLEIKEKLLKLEKNKG